MVVKTKNLDFLEILKKYEKKFNCFKNKDSIQIYSKLYKKQTENEKEKLLKNLGKIIYFSYRKNSGIRSKSTADSQGKRKSETKFGHLGKIFHNELLLNHY